MADRDSGGPTKAQLYDEARSRNIRGRSKLTKRQLQLLLRTDGDVSGPPSGQFNTGAEVADGRPIVASPGWVGPARKLVQDAVSTAAAGYVASRPVERSLFRMTSSFAVTIATSRCLNYVREQRRTLPSVRKAGRVLAQAPGSNSVRVHHFLPGVGIGLAAGGVAIARGTGRSERWLSLPFGVGVALTTDELRLLIGRNNAYWGGERFAWLQSAVASAVSLGFSVLFLRRGHAADRSIPAEPSTSGPDP